MPHILAELTPLDPVAGSRVTLRAASAQDRSITGLGSFRWWPAIADLPTLTMRLFDGDFTSDIEVGGASFSVLIDKLAKLDANARRFLWAGAGVKLYAGESGAAWPWTQIFDGQVERFDAQANKVRLQARVNTDAFEKNALTATYAGTGGIEGGADLKNKVKPWVFGRAANVEPVLIDAVNSVFQFSAYGPIQAVTALYERASDFGASIGDYGSYALLVAATIPRGRWGTCLAQGLVRLGAPPYGLITGDVDGDNPSTWLRKTGEIINRIATNAGVPAGLIDSASLTALDAAVPYNINLVLDEQTTVLDIARRLARPCNAQAGVSWLGKLFVTRVAIGSPAITLDAQGRRKPGVLSSSEVDVSPPYWRIEMGAQRSWRVHSFDEIAFASALTDRGLYVASEFYREGHIVDLANGSRWLYTNPTPTSGNAPPSSGTSNAYWSQMKPPTTAGDVGASHTYPPSATAPTSPTPQPGHLWPDTSSGVTITRRYNGTSWDRISNDVTQGSDIGVENGATAGATIGANVRDAGGAVQTEGNVLNDRMRVGVDTSGTGGRARVLVSRDGGGTLINAQELPAAAQNKDQLWIEVNGPEKPSDYAGTSIKFNLIGALGIAVRGNTLDKTASLATFNDAAVSIIPLTGGAHAEFQVKYQGAATGIQAHIFLSTDPTHTDAEAMVGKVGIAAGFFNGDYYFNNGTWSAAQGAWSTSDVWSIRYDSGNVQLWRNRTLVSSMDVAADQTVFLKIFMKNSGAQVFHVQFTPMADRGLEAPGSNRRLGDPRNLPAIAGANLGYKFTGSISYTADTLGNATISVTAGSLLMGGGSADLSLNAMSANVTGTAGTSVIYQLYINNPSFASGSHTLVQTTNGNDVFGSTGRMRIGSVKVDYPASGTTSTSGTGTGGSGGGGGHEP